jgi:hypothetical protein
MAACPWAATRASNSAKNSSNGRFSLEALKICFSTQGW